LKDGEKNPKSSPTSKLEHEPLNTTNKTTHKQLLQNVQDRPYLPSCIR
jgi:hypothetical protein